MKLRLPLPLLAAIATIASSSLLHAETISTWEQLNQAIANPSGTHILGNDLIIDSSTGVIDIPANSSFTLDGGSFAIRGGDTLGDKKTTFQNAGEFTLSKITFSNNGVQTSVSLPQIKSEANAYGGAIHNTGKLNISNNSSFTENIANSTGSASVKSYNQIINVIANSYGGAIYNANTTETQIISNTTFTRNIAKATTTGTDLTPFNAFINYGNKPVLQANAYGGAIYNAGSMEINSSSFEGNSAQASSNYIYSLAQGGAIYNSATSGKTTITGGSFTNNFASSHVETYELENSSMDRIDPSWRPHAQGGAIYQAGGFLSITGTLFKGNYTTTSSEYAYSIGGAIYNLGSAHLENVIFEGNYAQGTCSTQNYVSTGAIFNGGNSTMIINSSTFTGNYATAPASIAGTGAIHNAGGSMSISNSKFENNYASGTSTLYPTSANSGAISNTPGTRADSNLMLLTITNTSFTGNYATANINNSASSAYAGALSNMGSKVIISAGTTFTKNYSSANKLAFAGAIYNNTGGIMSIENSIFEENYAAASMDNGSSIAQGGAISNIGKQLNIISTQFNKNQAKAGGNSFGGAIYHEHAGDKFDITSVTFTDNNAMGSTSAAGGAIYHILRKTLAVSTQKTSITSSSFTNNHATGGTSATGGAIHHIGEVVDIGSIDKPSKMTHLSISDTTFTGNHATASSSAAGGAIYHSISNLILSNVTFTGNYVSSPSNSAMPSSLHGGAIYNKGYLTIINSTFENNYTMAGNDSLGGAIFANGQDINIIASGQDTIFRGNRQNVTNINENGIPLDGKSNAIYAQQGCINLYTSETGSVIFYDSIQSNGAGCLNINPDNVTTGYPTTGTAYFKDGVMIEDFKVTLNNGTMSMGNNTTIKGNVSANTDTTFLISGFTKLEGNYAIKNTSDGAHTVYIDMDDNMIGNYSEEKPVWNFNNGQSSLSNVDGGKLDFILDIGGINNFPEHFRPYIFSHFGQTEELMETVRNADNVILIDTDGWTYRIPEIYTEGNRTLDYFDFLSGQYGELDPFDPNNPNWAAPTGVGSAQVETLWTTTRSLWSFADGVRTQNKTRLKQNKDTAIWISGIGNYYTQENQPHIQGYRYRSWGTSVGGEYTFSPEWSAGAALGEIWGKHDINNRMGNVDKDATLALLYLNRTIKLDNTNTLVLNLQGGYENSRNKGSVKINPFINDSLYGTWRDQAWMADLRATWIRPINEKTWLDTYAGLQYTYAEQGNGTISGDKYKFALSDGNMYDFRATIGTGIRHIRDIHNHSTLFYVRTGIIQDIQRDVPHVGVRGEERNWTAVGSKPGRTAFNFNAGASVQIIDNWSMGIDYTLEAANKSLMQTGRVSVMCEF